MDNGNLLGLVSSYTTADGAQRAMADVWFARSPDSPAAAPPLDELLAPAAQPLPATLADEPNAPLRAPMASPVAVPASMESNLLREPQLVDVRVATPLI